MTSNTKRSLFGGALLAAGIVAPAANAQNLSFQYTYAFVLAYDNPNQYQFDYAVWAAGGNFAITAAVDGASAAVDHNNLSMSARGTSDNKGYLGGGYSVFSYFQADQNTMLNVSWDFTADLDGIGGAYLDSHLAIYDVSGGFVNIFNADLNNPVGTAQVPITAGNQYYLNGLAIGLNGAGTSYYNVAVPTPGSAALLGLAGIAAGRRRR